MAIEPGSLAFQPPHPGEYLREDILPYVGMNAAQLANHLGVSKQTISNLTAEKRGVSTDMAIRLGQAFKNGARFWLALQMQYDLWQQQNASNVEVKPIDWDGEVA